MAITTAEREAMMYTAAPKIEAMLTPTIEILRERGAEEVMFSSSLPKLAKTQEKIEKRAKINKVNYFNGKPIVSIWDGLQQLIDNYRPEQVWRKDNATSLCVLNEPMVPYVIEAFMEYCRNREQQQQPVQRPVERVVEEPEVEENWDYE